MIENEFSPCAVLWFCEPLIDTQKYPCIMVCIVMDTYRYP